MQVVQKNFWSISYLNCFLSRFCDFKDAFSCRYLVQAGCIKPLCNLLETREARIVKIAMEALENILKVKLDCQVHIVWFLSARKIFSSPELFNIVKSIVKGNFDRSKVTYRLKDQMLLNVWYQTDCRNEDYPHHNKRGSPWAQATEFDSVFWRCYIFSSFPFNRDKKGTLKFEDNDVVWLDLIYQVQISEQQYCQSVPGALIMPGLSW